MAIFKKKSVLLVAAILAACAMFFACTTEEEEETRQPKSKFTVTFKVGEVVVESITKDSGTVIPLPSIRNLAQDSVVKTWFFGEDLNPGGLVGNADDNDLYKIIKNITLYGEWVEFVGFIVTFTVFNADSEGNWGDIDSTFFEVVEAGRNIKLPEIAKMVDGKRYELNEWFDENGSSVGLAGVYFGPVNSNTDLSGALTPLPQLNLLDSMWIYGENKDPAEDTSAWFPVYYGQGIDPDLDEPLTVDGVDLKAYVNNIVKKVDDVVSWSMEIGNHAQYPVGHPCRTNSQWDGFWPHANMSVYFAGPTVGYFLTDDFQITLTWKANESITLVLGDTIKFEKDDKPLLDCREEKQLTSSSTGAGYRVILPARPLGGDTTLTKEDFNQPRVGAPDWRLADYTYDFDAGSVVMLSFGAFSNDHNSNRNKPTNVEITRLEIKNVAWRGITQP